MINILANLFSSAVSVQAPWRLLSQALCVITKLLLIDLLLIYALQWLHPESSIKSASIKRHVPDSELNPVTVLRVNNRLRRNKTTRSAVWRKRRDAVILTASLVATARDEEIINNAGWSLLP